MFLVALIAAVATPVQKFFTQPCDHFNAIAYGCTFQQKYFIDDSAWKGSDNPHAMITFIPGGEAAMGGMYNYAVLRDLATSRGGLVLTMEHRYYGDSLPFGNHSRDRSPDRLGLASIEQAMSDYANLIETVRGAADDAPD